MTRHAREGAIPFFSIPTDFEQDREWRRLRRALSALDYHVAMAAWLRVVSECNRKRVRDPFTDRDDMIDFLDGPADHHIAALVEAHLLDDTGIPEHTWDKWCPGRPQRPSDLARGTTREERRAYDESRRTPPHTAAHAAPTTHDYAPVRTHANGADPTPVGRAAPKEMHELEALAESLTQRPAVLLPYTKHWEVALEQMERHGVMKVSEAWRASAISCDTQPPTIQQVVYGAMKRLDRIPDPPRQNGSGLGKGAPSASNMEAVIRRS